MLETTPSHCVALELHLDLPHVLCVAPLQDCLGHILAGRVQGTCAFSLGAYGVANTTLDLYQHPVCREGTEQS